MAEQEGNFETPKGRLLRDFLRSSAPPKRIRETRMPFFEKTTRTDWIMPADIAETLQQDEQRLEKLDPPHWQQRLDDLIDKVRAGRSAYTRRPSTWQKRPLPEGFFNEPVDLTTPLTTNRRHLMEQAAHLRAAATAPAVKQAAPEEVMTPATQPTMDIMVCQDDYGIPTNTKGIAEILRDQGHSIRVESVTNKSELLRRLKERHDKGWPAPTDFFMDVGGVGAAAAKEVLDFIEKNHPGSPLPTINFCSLSLSMGIEAARKVRQQDGRVMASAIDHSELSWALNRLGGQADAYGTPETTTMRDLFNEKLGCSLPLDQNTNGYCAKEMRDMMAIANDGVLFAWRQGRMPAGEAISRMRNFATDLSASLQSGFYMQGGDAAGLKTDAAFYGSAGYPKKGTVAFSLSEVEDIHDRTGERPILVMNGYDPAVVPMMAEGKLGGLVVTSSFMASHLKLMCETHMVTGLFGTMPAGKTTLSDHFNEEAEPDGPVYFSGDKVKINGKTIRRGQQILVGLGGNGMMVKPPDSVQTTNNDVQELKGDDKIKLRMLRMCFEAYFREQGLPVPGVKANVDAGNSRQLDMVDGIGLVRTEQMAVANQSLLGSIKQALLGGEPNDEAYRNIATQSSYTYSNLVTRLDDNQPVKIRLFDFVHDEILNKGEQRQFLEKYPKLDIHGGEALETWPRLYREQVRSIFDALKWYSYHQATPLEIMMPAVRTEEDVRAIKNIVDEEAQRAGIKPDQYSFGVMAETLDCCTNIEKIAPLCDFISFGTNDLTQQYTGMARGDLKAHARFAQQHGYDPFKILDPAVMGIVCDVTARARKANPALKVDICGAQAADPKTAVQLFRTGINNISVAPNPANLFALPLQLGYMMYDASLKTRATHRPPAAGMAAYG